MAKDQRNVEAITPMEVDFAKWYTDICLKAELVDYASVKGFMILRPYGYAIWENIQRIMDGMFKKTGHVNVAMPVLIPESLLKKEGELVEGFAPEVAWVTHGGSEKLEERLAFRPTSETMFCDHWHNVLQSYRELPMLYNQWCSVIRWEKTTRPFLRSREFWWQEGHTIHETAEEAQAETEQQLKCYADFFENVLAIPVVPGRKTEKEKFAGAEATYTVECMMKDRKALQGATSHYFGDKFSRAYDVTFTGRDNKLQYPFQTSWGSTTRMIGAVIMTHGDNNGLVLPPRIAPVQAVVIPIAAHKKPEVAEAAKELKARLLAIDVRSWTTSISPWAGSAPSTKCAVCRCASRSARATSRTASAASSAATTGKRPLSRSTRSRARSRNCLTASTTICSKERERIWRRTPSTCPLGRRSRKWPPAAAALRAQSGAAAASASWA